MERTAVGIGYRADHAAVFEAQWPPLPLIEVHAENYVVDGAARARLSRLRQRYEISLHSVGLSLLGSGPDAELLEGLAELAHEIEPALISVHMAWLGTETEYFEGLFPFVRNMANLAVATESVDRLQQRFGQRVLVENLAAAAEFEGCEISEPEFLSELVRRTGCGLLLDINNLVISSHNLGHSAADWMKDVPVAAVQQFHLAGHGVTDFAGQAVLLDSHDRSVADSCWDCFTEAVRAFGPQPTVVERDADLPPLQDLVAEAGRAAAVLQCQAIAA